MVLLSINQTMCVRKDEGDEETAKPVCPVQPRPHAVMFADDSICESNCEMKGIA